VKTIEQLARELVPEAVEVLTEIMFDEGVERETRVSAAAVLLDHGFLTPHEAAVALRIDMGAVLEALQVRDVTEGRA